MSEHDRTDPSSEFGSTDQDHDVDVTIDADADATPCAYTAYVERGEVEGLPATGEHATGLEKDVWDALYAVEDPEMPVSIVDLGLIYKVELEAGEDDEDGTHARVIMTLTYTGCPARSMLTDEVEAAAESPVASTRPRSNSSGVPSGPSTWSPIRGKPTSVNSG